MICYKLKTEKKTLEAGERTYEQERAPWSRTRFEKSKHSMSRSIETTETLIFGQKILELSKSKTFITIRLTASMVNLRCGFTASAAASTIIYAILGGYHFAR